MKKSFKSATTIAVLVLCVLAARIAFRAGKSSVAPTSDRAETTAILQSVKTPASPQSASAIQLAATTNKIFATADVLWQQTPSEKTFARFQNWAGRYIKSSPAEKIELEAEGIQLAKARREELAALIRVNPERALEMVVPVGVRRALPASVVALLEERVSGRGQLAVLAALAEAGKENQVVPTWRTATIGERKFAAFAYGWRLGEPTRNDIPLNGIALDNLFAVNENPLRILEPEEASDAKAAASETICSVSGQLSTVNEEEIVGEVGGKPVFFCALNHAVEANDRIVAAEGGGPTGGDTPNVQASSYTEGQKKLLFIRVDFPNLTGAPVSSNSLGSLASSLNDFYSEMSYGRASFALMGSGSDVTATLRMSHPAEWYGTNDDFDGLRTEARSAASAAGFVLANYDFDVICMGAVQGWSWAGLAYVGATGAWLRNSFSVSTASHELGHNFGLNHANFWDTSGQSVIGPGTNDEYGDEFDTMGGGGAGIKHFNARYKAYLNWLTTSEAITATSNGTYRIYAHDDANSSGVRALKILRSGNTTNFWLEFRQKFSGNKWLMNGAGLRWAKSGNQNSLLLDTTPGSPDDRDDSAIVIGRTFSDKAFGIHVTPVAKGGTTPESLDVVVNLGTFPNNVAPIVTLIASGTNAPVDSTLSFTGTAFDPNGDAMAYLWDFGDGSLGTNGAVVSHSWNFSGEYVVRCDVTDMKGGVGSRFVIVKIGSSSKFHISGQVVATNGPVQGVRVYTSSAQSAYTDSDGNYVIPGLSSGGYDVFASLYGFNFTNSGFSNPVQVGPNAGNINFADGNYIPPNGPGVSIVTPSQNARLSNAVITVQGTTTSSTPVTNVFYQINTGSWIAAQTANAWLSWSGDVTPTPGANTIRAYAEDSDGNVSPIVSVTFVYILSAPLVLQISGSGTVSPDYNGQLLEVGKTYTMTATPLAGNLFSNWAGSIVTNTAKLTFVMQSNLVFQANFVTNLFIAIAGSYNGLFYETAGAIHESSGFFSGKVTSKGTFSGKISLAGKSYSLSSKLNLEGKATNSIARTGLTPLALELDCSTADELNGRVSDGAWSADLLADKALFNATTNPAPQAGKYTLDIPGNADPAASPGGDGCGAVTVDAAGKIKLSGTLGDGTKISQKTSLSKNGQWPLYVSLYKGAGSIIAWITITNGTPKEFGGDLIWTKKPNPLAKFYPAGFTNNPTASGPAYTPPLPGNPVLNFTSAIVWFSGGNLPQTFSNNVSLGADNKVTNLSSNKLSLKFTLATGLFSGKVTDPLTLKAISFKGAVSQKQNSGFGFFLGTNQSGSSPLQGN